MTHHTPGPWTAEEGFVYAGERWVADCLMGYGIHDIANAQLIAAAPDLLGALKESISLLRYARLNLTNTQFEADPVVKRIRKAIRKAGQN